jgi:uncharacterized protein with ParB-like and HNH nuclease domain
MTKRMDVFPKPLTAVSAFKRMNKGEIDLAPEYQRGKVWSRKRQALLIDSMLRGYDLPKFYLREVPEGPDEVVDGQQRLNAIAAFFANELPLPRESGDLAGKRYEQLPTDISDDIDDLADLKSTHRRGSVHRSEGSGLGSDSWASRTRPGTAER